VEVTIILQKPLQPDYRKWGQILCPSRNHFRLVIKANKETWELKMFSSEPVNSCQYQILLVTWHSLKFSFSVYKQHSSRKERDNRPVIPYHCFRHDRVMICYWPFKKVPELRTVRCSLTPYDNYSRNGEKAAVKFPKNMIHQNLSVMIVGHFCLGQNTMVQIPILSFLQLAL